MTTLKNSLIGIRVKGIGIGDAIQFTSVPENYFRHVGAKLVDIDSSWVFDHNPYVIRNVERVNEEHDLWRMHCLNVSRTIGNRTVLLSSAEAHSRHLYNYPIVLNRPRLYLHEEYPFELRERIYLHVKGRSHGRMPEHIVKHVLTKYRKNLYCVGLENEWDYDLPKPEYIHTKTMWDLAAILSKAKLFIGVDSGPSWVAQCYPDVIVKKVRLIPKIEELKNWVPLEICRLNSHWDDRSAMIYNVSENDVGFTWSYRRI